MIITNTVGLKDITEADEFNDYQWDIGRITALIRLLEYVKMDNRILEFTLKDGVMCVKVLR